MIEMLMDFENELFGMLCSEDYRNAVNSIKNRKENVAEIEDKEKTLLQAFMDEVNRAYEENKNVPRKIVEYLIDSGAYHKHDTLNKPIDKLPTRLVALEFKPDSDNTVEMYLDGWQINFRMESSLKLDAQFIGVPTSDE